MGTALELLNDIKDFNPMETAVDVLNASEGYADAQRDQLLHGQRSDGSRIMEPSLAYRSPKYAREKQSMNGKAGLFNPDLKLTGAFHRSIAAEIQGENIIVEASDSKAAGLEEKYGGTIYGLNEKNQQGYNKDVFLPDFMAALEKATGLKMS